MSRLPDLDPALLDDERRSIYDRIAGKRGALRGVWPIQMRIPEVARHYHAIYERLQAQPKIGRRLLELMIIVVARHWTSQFEWHGHERQAREHGIDPAIVDAIRERRPPPFKRDDERLVYELIHELCETTRVTAAVYERALAAFGEEGLVLLIVGAGTYASFALQLNAFEVSIPLDARPLA